MFPTYGVPMISGAPEALSPRQQRRARQPLHARHRLPRDAVENDHERQGPRAGTSPEIAEAARPPLPEDVVDCARGDRRAVSLYEAEGFPPTAATPSHHEPNQGGDGRRLAPREIAIREAIHELSPREKKDPLDALYRRQNADRGRRGDRHLAGTGFPLRERRDAQIKASFLRRAFHGEWDGPQRPPRSHASIKRFRRSRRYTALLPPEVEPRQTDAATAFSRTLSVKTIRVPPPGLKLAGPFAGHIAVFSSRNAHRRHTGSPPCGEARVA